MYCYLLISAFKLDWTFYIYTGAGLWILGAISNTIQDNNPGLVLTEINKKKLEKQYKSQNQQIPAVQVIKKATDKNAKNEE